MNFELHFLSQSDPGKPALKTALARCQREGGAPVTTVFDTELIQQLTRQKKTRFHAHKKASEGALPALAAWLLRNAAGSRTQLDAKTSDQIGEFLRKGDTHEKLIESWLYHLFGGDPKPLFRKNETQKWQPSDQLENIKVTFWRHASLESLLDGTQPAGNRLISSADLLNAAEGLCRGSLEISIFARSGVDYPWQPLAYTGGQPVKPDVQLKVVVRNSDEKPRHIAVVLVSPSGKTFGLWPWIPAGNHADGWGDQLAHRGFKQSRNPRVELTLPDAWADDPAMKEPADRSFGFTVTGNAECLLAFTYRGGNTKDADSKILDALRKHLEKPEKAVVQALKRWAGNSAIDLELRLPPPGSTAFSQQKDLAIGHPPAAISPVRELQITLTNELAALTECGIELARIVVIPTRQS